MQKRRFQEPLDEDNEDKSDSKISLPPEARFGRPNDVDAMIARTAPKEYGIHEGVRPSGVTARMPVGRTSECYNTNHQRRGKCVVFNHETFDPTFSRRMGSQVDVERIITTFTKLGFEVIVHNDLFHSNIMDQINRLSKEDHSGSDCLCIFVLTHGLGDNYLMAKDAAYGSARIWKPFTAEKCPTLAGKPKLFFFEAGRGEKLDDGVTLVPRSHLFNNPNTGEKLDSDMRSVPFVVNIQPSITSSSYKIPSASDFLIAHSCTEGFSSWRSPVEGTWYVQSLCKVLDEFAESTDLLKMLTITARKVATDFQSFNGANPDFDGKKQVPSVSSTLTRDLYFA